MIDRYFFKKEKGKIVGYFPKLPDGNYEINEAKQIRTIKQNALYWAYFLKQLVLFHKELGEVKTIESMHKELKRIFLKFKLKSDFSKKFVRKIGSTASLNTKQFKAYMEKINNFYMEIHGWSVDLDINQSDLEYWEKQVI